MHYIIAWGSPSLDLNLHPVFSPGQCAARCVLVLSRARWIAEAHLFSARYYLVWMRYFVLVRKPKCRRMVGCMGIFLSKYIPKQDI